eukprot:g22282.t1
MANTFGMPNTAKGNLGALPEEQALPAVGTLGHIDAPKSSFEKGQTLEVWSDSKKAWLPGVVLASYESDTSAEGYDVPAGTVKAILVRGAAPDRAAGARERAVARDSHGAPAVRAASVATSCIAMATPTPQQERVALRRSLYAPANARSVGREIEQCRQSCRQIGPVKKNKLPTQAFLRAAEFGNFDGVRKYQFTELPELINAVGHVQTLEPQPDLDIFDTRAISKNKSKTARPETPPLARTKGITGRLARSENNLTRLASTLTVRHEVCEAAKSQPRLIWEKARSGEQALPALARALKNERLAVRATQMNPKLLRVGEPQIRKIMPTLVSICGGAEQAAYAIVWRPELLELEAASALRDSLQAASGFFGNLKDALFLLGQTTAPPSVRVIARQFCREYMVGEYFLVDGAQVDDRPVWCKPAAAMQSLGSKAKDVYLIYCQKGVDYCDPSILGWTEAKVKSPDQVEPGQWHFPAEAHKTQVPGLWPADPFATGLVWLTESTGTGPTPGGARLLGHFIKNDPVYADSSKITFLDLADFAHIRRWSYLQLPLAPAGQPVEKSVKLYAWEPVEVCMDLDPNTAAELRRAEFRPTPERAVAKSFPKLQGAPAPVSEEVWARTYASGPFEVPEPWQR